MQRSCGVRLTSRGSFYSQLNGPSGHVHKSSTSSSIEFLLKKQYRVERVLTLDTIRPSISTSSTVKPNQIVYSQILGRTNISPITSSTEGDVLKRLLLAGNSINHFKIALHCFKLSIYHAGREQTMTVPSTSLLSDYSRNALSLQILRHDPESSAFRLKSDELRPLFESPRLGEGSTDTWTPPVLTPSPVDEQPPLVPVAHIEPYPDPQVMYNPYFLQQLDAHRKSPSD